jgi:uncharacterized protein YdgA (DUF945 family)
MKKFIILLVILVICVLAAPGIIGFQAETRYQELLSEMEKGGFEIAKSDYQRGWFDSSAETELRISTASATGPAQGGMPEEFRFTLRSEIIHGPLSPDGGFGVAQIRTHVISEGETLFPQQTDGLLKTNIDLDGNGITVVDVPSLETGQAEGETGVRFDGITGTVTFNAQFSEFDMDLGMPGLVINGKDGELFEIDSIALISESKKGIAGLMLGEAAFTIARIKFADPAENMAVDIDGIKITAETRAEGDKLLFSAIYALQAVKVKEELYGPAEIQISARNLAADTVAKMKQEIEEINSQKLPEAQRGMAVLSVLMGTGSDLLKSDPLLAIDRLQVETPEGSIQGEFSVQSRGLTIEEISNAPVALNKLEVEASLRMPETLFVALFENQSRSEIMKRIELRRQLGEEVEEPSAEELEEYTKSMAAQKLNGLIQQEFLVRDGKYLASVGGLSGGLLTVNGKTVALPTGQPPQPGMEMESAPAPTVEAPAPTLEAPAPAAEAPAPAAEAPAPAAEAPAPAAEAPAPAAEAPAPAAAEAPAPAE